MLMLFLLPAGTSEMTLSEWPYLFHEHKYLEVKTQSVSRVMHYVDINSA